MHGHGAGAAAWRVRLAVGLRERQGAAARAPGALRVHAPGGARATVEVFQASVGSRVVGNRRIARFTGRGRSFTWSGRRARDGVLFARFRVRVAKGVSDVRRVTLRRATAASGSAAASTGAAAAAC